MIDSLFDLCVQAMIWLGHATGLIYEAVNILLFVIIHPAITLFLFLKMSQYKRLSKNLQNNHK